MFARLKKWWRESDAKVEPWTDTDAGLEQKMQPPGDPPVEMADGTENKRWWGIKVTWKW